MSQKTIDFVKRGGGYVNPQLLKLIGLLFLPNLIAWSILTPGYLQADHQVAVAEFAQGHPMQHHSLIWTILAFPFLYWTPSLSLYGLAQIILYVLCVTICLVRLQRVGVIKNYMGLGLLFALFPTYILYNELYASDTVFAYALMVVTALAIELVYTRGEALENPCYVALLTAFLVLASVLRKNALPIFFIVCILLACSFRKRGKAVAKVFCAGFAMLLLLLAVIPAALQAMPSSSSEALSVPALQISRVFADGGTIPPEQMEHLVQYRSPEEWAAAYLPYCADYAKKDVPLSLEFLYDWVIVGINNPGSYVKAYLMLECPFWQFGMVGYGEAALAVNQNGTEIDFGDWRYFTLDHAAGLKDSYVSQFGSEGDAHWLPAGIYRTVNELHIPLVTSLFNLVFFNRALPLWMLVGVMIVLIRKKAMRQSWVIVAPVLVVIAGFLLFAPEGLFRYSMQAYYALPFLGLWLYVVCSGRIKPS